MSRVVLSILLVTICMSLAAQETTSDASASDDSVLQLINEEASLYRQAQGYQRELTSLRTSSERLNIQRGILITVLVVLALVVLLQWSLNRHRWKLNQILQAKNNKIEEQKRELEKALERLHAAAMERESAHQEIVELERKNSVLALAVTANHEINQPLMVILGNIDLIEMNPTLDKRDQYIGKIRDSISQIQEILQKLNKLHKVHFKQYSSNTSMVDLDRLLEGDGE